MSGRHSERAIRRASGARGAGARHTRAGMAWRQFAADPWVSAALAALVLAASLSLQTLAYL